MTYVLHGDPATATLDAVTAAKEYNAVAKTYDADYEEKVGWMTVCSKVYVPLLNRHVPTSASILDVGCGTGALVKKLRETGYDGCIHGLDVSPEMIELCKSSGAFQTAYVHDLYEKIPATDGDYDLVMTTAAVLFVNNPGLMAELARCVKPGGHLFISSRRDRMEEFGYVDELAGLVSSGQFEEQHKDVSPLAGKREEYRKDDFHYMTFVFQKASTKRQKTTHD